MPIAVFQPSFTPRPPMVNNTSDETFEQFLAQAQEFSDESSLSVSISPLAASALLYQLQQASRLPGNTGAFALMSDDFVRQLQSVVGAGLQKQRERVEQEMREMEAQLDAFKRRWQNLLEFSNKIGMAQKDTTTFAQMPLPPAGQGAGGGISYPGIPQIKPHG